MKTRALLLSSGVALGSFVASTQAHAAGTGLDIMSGRGVGMASAMVAHTNGSDSLYFNPAGIAQGKQLDVSAGVSLVIPGYKYTDNNGTSTKLPTAVAPPFHVYATAGITDNLSVGVGINTPFGLTLKWPDNWVGRSQIIKTSNINYNINPSFAYHLGPFRFGAGLQIVRSTVELVKAVQFPDQEGRTQLSAGSWGVGGNVGAQLEAIPKYLDLGIHYRSRVKLDYDEGHAHFSNVPTALQGTFFDQNGSTSLTLPDSLSMGLASHPIDNLLVAVDVNYFTWSVFKSIDIAFPQTAALNQHEAKNFHNRFNYHLGGEYTINDNFKVRAGIMYDPTPSPPSTLGPDVPDANRINLAAGVGYKHDCGFYGDLGYQHIFLLSHTSSYAPLPGEYSGSVEVIGITLGFKWNYGDKPAPVAPPPPPPPDAGPAPENTPPTGDIPPGSTPPSPVPPAPNPAPDSANPAPAN